MSLECLTAQAAVPLVRFAPTHRSNPLWATLTWSFSVVALIPCVVVVCVWHRTGAAVLWNGRCCASAFRQTGRTCEPRMAPGQHHRHHGRPSHLTKETPTTCSRCGSLSTSSVARWEPRWEPWSLWRGCGLLWRDTKLGHRRHSPPCFAPVHAVKHLRTLVPWGRVLCHRETRSLYFSPWIVDHLSMCSAIRGPAPHATRAEGCSATSTTSPWGPTPT